MSCKGLIPKKKQHAITVTEGLDDDFIPAKRQNSSKAAEIAKVPMIIMIILSINFRRRLRRRR